MVIKQVLDKIADSGRASPSEVPQKAKKLSLLEDFQQRLQVILCHLATEFLGQWGNGSYSGTIVLIERAIINVKNWLVFSLQQGNWKAKMNQGNRESFRFRIRSTWDTYEKANGDGLRGPTTPYDV
ncbi:hypothetical protein Patl1_22359 [Pistacia atlantica]|uniref:Uncharacterized protein n=1 Tax=Pistacia atlantica TaxID=434234 RepID=A0ACC1A0S1_9ROSI|nr:hypothetical protein Patl1_22359 [Pistacia atlantica]